MKKFNSKFHLYLMLFFMGAFSFMFSVCLAQEKQKTNRDSIIVASKEIIGIQTYCALITLDSDGLPNARTMNPYAIEDDMIVWMATNRQSRKVKEILNNPNVCVYFADHKSASGYLALKGKAEIIDDKGFTCKEEKKILGTSCP